MPSSNKLFPVSILPEKYQNLFSFEYFNEIQSKIFNLLFNSTRSIVIASPTGSGKTIMAELAIIKYLEDNQTNKRGKIVYLSPLKALTYEKERNFNKFNQLGVRVQTFTGDTSQQDQDKGIYSKIKSTDIIITTIEKFDSLTRRKSFLFLMNNLKVLVIDEIHLLSDISRGPVLEAVLTRIKTTNNHCRFIGLSATLPNVELIADWLNAETVFFGEKFRPTALTKKMSSYNSTGNDFKDKYRRIFISWNIIKKYQYSQTLVFVNSRADTVLSAKKFLDYMVKYKQTRPLNLQINCQNQKLQEFIQYGIGFHHAGLTRDDKEIVEWLFREKKLLILVATSTLAWGINLPARVVIIQDYEIRSENFETELISASDINQMFGRAGRPGYDTNGFGHIIVQKGKTEEQIKVSLLNQQGISSSLNEKLEEVVLGEIFRKHYTLIELEHFFQSSLYWKQNSNPIDHDNFLESITSSLEHLEWNNIIIKVDNEYRITPVGSLIGQYYIDIESGIELAKYCSKRVQTGLALLYNVIKRIKVFREFPVRSSEKKIIKTKEVLSLTQQEENQSLLKVFAILYFKIQDKPLPVELMGDSFIINHTFMRYWEFFKAVYRFMNGDQYFINTRSLAKELIL